MVESGNDNITGHIVKGVSTGGAYVPWGYTMEFSSSSSYSDNTCSCT